MIDPNLPVPLVDNGFDLSLSNRLMPEAPPSALDPEPARKPENLREPWQGLLEIERDEDALPVTGSELERAVYLRADQVDRDVWWEASGLETLRAVMSQNEDGRRESAGHEFVIVEPIRPPAKVPSQAV